MDREIKIFVSTGEINGKREWIVKVDAQDWEEMDERERSELVLELLVAKGMDYGYQDA